MQQGRYWLPPLRFVLRETLDQPRNGRQRASEEAGLWPRLRPRPEGKAQRSRFCGPAPRTSAGSPAVGATSWWGFACCPGVPELSLRCESISANPSGAVLGPPNLSVASFQRRKVFQGRLHFYSEVLSGQSRCVKKLLTGVNEDRFVLSPLSRWCLPRVGCPAWARAWAQLAQSVTRGVSHTRTALGKLAAELRRTQFLASGLHTEHLVCSFSVTPVPATSPTPAV